MKLFYIGACCLFLAAIACEIIGKRACAQAAYAQADCAVPGQPEQIVAKLKSDSRDALSWGDRVTMAGMIAAGLGLALWLVSLLHPKQHAKRLSPVVPLGLVITYVMLWLMMV